MIIKRGDFMIFVNRTMKKLYVAFFVLSITALVAGCGASGSSQTKVGIAPDWVNDDPPEDGFCGIGFAKTMDPSLGYQTAVFRARRDIAAQISAAVTAMLRDYSREAGTINNPAAVKSIESVGMELIDRDLTNARVVKRQQTSDGSWWVKVELGTRAAAKIANDSVVDNEAARFAEWKHADAEKRMEYELQKRKSQSAPTPRSVD